jgi:hypothetical protein
MYTILSGEIQKVNQVCATLLATSVVVLNKDKATSMQ